MIFFNNFRYFTEYHSNIQNGGILLTTANHDYDLHIHMIHNWHLYCATHVYEYSHNEQHQQYSISKICIITSHLDTKQKKSTPGGFSQTTCEPIVSISFLVGVLPGTTVNHSGTVSTSLRLTHLILVHLPLTTLARCLDALWFGR